MLKGIAIAADEGKKYIDGGESEWGDASRSANNWEVLRLRKMEGKSWRKEVRVNKVECDKRIINSNGKEAGIT